MDIISTEKENEFLNFTFYLFKRELIKGFQIDFAYVSNEKKDKINVDVEIFYDNYPRNSFVVHINEVFLYNKKTLYKNTELKIKFLNILYNTFKEQYNEKSYISIFRDNIEKFLKS